MPSTLPTDIADPVNARILAVSEDRIAGFLEDPFAEIARLSDLPVETVLERLSSGVITVDGDGALRTANAAAGAILGVELDASTGQPLRAIVATQPALSGFVERIESRRREGRREWREELRL